ncbi:hypothetical protein [Bradyrhizobium sp. AS23.2]|uniref:hypothetical protein n=1 Tax=Bradyrhizobium sp. AS23.2 TaxID=1680155 RepID=UPI00093D2F3E|nr:hypothetical protein [Bradyrhizobium sp. AS23.2]OKO86827.1 hypothetical protein AC630_01920 [Bradyrhizobium sp. AS23.2]
MKACLSADILQPVIDALAPTGMGRPKTQAVITEHLELFEAMLEAGYTYEQIAGALNAGGALSRKGTRFKGNSLHNCISRAKVARAGKRPAAEIGVRAPLADHNVATATTSGWDQDLSPELSEFKQRISDAQSFAARGEILFDRTRRK